MRAREAGLIVAALALSSLSQAQEPPGQVPPQPTGTVQPYPAPPPTAGPYGQPGAPGPYGPGTYPSGPNPYQGTQPGAYPQPYPYPYPYAQPYGYNNPDYTPPSTKKKGYRRGDPVPPGYHVEERTRDGLVTAGVIVTAVPYGIGLLAASAASFENKSAWLFAPWVGPWLLLGQRNYACKHDHNAADDANDGLKCVGEIFLVMGLIMDGLVQTAGGILTIVGYSATKATLVPDAQSVRVTPLRVGTGYGAGLVGQF